MLEALATGNLDIYDEVIGPDFVDHDPQNPFAAASAGPSLCVRGDPVSDGIPGPGLTVEDQHEDGDIVVSRCTVTGTQMGGLPGLRATGKQIVIGGVQIDRFEGDQIAESWRYWDTLGMLQQLGAVPAHDYRPTSHHAPLDSRPMCHAIVNPLASLGVGPAAPDSRRRLR